jgi:hypothetical protein
VAGAELGDQAAGSRLLRRVLHECRRPVELHTSTMTQRESGGTTGKAKGLAKRNPSGAQSRSFPVVPESVFQKCSKPEGYLTLRSPAAVFGNSVAKPPIASAAAAVTVAESILWT